MLLYQFKELANLVEFGILTARLHREWTQKSWVRPYLVAAFGSNVFKAESHEQSLEVPKGNGAISGFE